jgi:hypothetical protein
MSVTSLTSRRKAAGLVPWQRRQLLAHLRRGPEAAGWPDLRWTRERIGAWLEHQLGAVLPEWTISKELAGLGWRPVPGVLEMGLTWAEVSAEEQQRLLAGARVVRLPGRHGRRRSA